MSIKAGDLVVVTKPQPCCGDTDGLGNIYRVQSVELMRGDTYCGKCSGKIGSDMQIAWIRRYATSGEGYSVPRLTRIDPLPDSETQDTNESLTA